MSTCVLLVILLLGPEVFCEDESTFTKTLREVTDAFGNVVKQENVLTNSDLLYTLIKTSNQLGEILCQTPNVSQMKQNNDIDRNLSTLLQQLDVQMNDAIKALMFDEKQWSNKKFFTVVHVPLKRLQKAFTELTKSLADADLTILKKLCLRQNPMELLNMTTKDYCLSLKDKDVVLDDVSNGQYSNLNLNQNNKQSFLEDTTISTSRYNYMNDNRKTDLTNLNDLQKRKDNSLSLWSNSSSEYRNNLSSSELYKMESKKQKEEKSLNKTSNSSTLSLHISAYENSIEGVSSSATNNDDENVAPKMKKNKEAGLIQKWKTSNGSSSAAAIQNLFEFPRQQEKGKNESINPEVMQFKASQKLLDPNKSHNAENSSRIGHPEGTQCSATCKSVSKILSILNSRYPSHAGNIVLTEVDRMAANMLEMNLIDVVRTGKIPQSYYDLELKGTDMIDDSDDSESETEEETDDEFDPNADKKYSSLPYTLNQMKSILDLYDDKRFTGNRLKRVMKRFRFIKNARQISRIRQQVREGGSRYYKAQQLRELLFQEFVRWKNERQVVRDRFLIDAALEIAEQLKYCTFKASATWLLSFKKHYGIVGRKITQVVSVKKPHEEADIEKLSKDFIERVKVTIDAERITPAKVYNSDQLGIQLEMTSGRTLAFKGEKQVQAVVQNKNATTHSLTVQPLISADGKLVLPVLVCFYEPNEPKCFKSDLAEFKNLHCVSTKSGKVTSELMKNWMKDIFLPAAPMRSMLLLDSWSGFNQAKEIPELKNKKITVITIPKKTTGIVQPLDVGHNRYTKAFYRTMSDKLRRICPNFMLSKRKNIARLLNQTFEQLAAPRFKSLIEHAFIKSGYFDHAYEHYRTPDDYCFNFSKVGARCQIHQCEKFAFIKCAWCERLLCINDFLMKLHCCRNNN